MTLAEDPITDFMIISQPALFGLQRDRERTAASVTIVLLITAKPLAFRLYLGTTSRIGHHHTASVGDAIQVSLTLLTGGLLVKAANQPGSLKLKS